MNDKSNRREGNSRSILVLSHTAQVGGASRSLEFMIDYLVRANFRVIILSPIGKAWKNWESAGAVVRVWSPPVCTFIGRSLFASYTAEISLDRIIYQLVDLVLLPLRLFQAKRLILENIEKYQIDTIYINSLSLFSLAGLIRTLRVINKRFVVWHIRELISTELPRFAYRAIAQAIARASDQIIAISSQEAKAFEGYKLVKVLHNPIPPDWPDEKMLRDPSKEILIAMSGAYRPSKGVSDFIAMAEVVHSKFNNSRYIIYSPHPFPKGIYRLIKALSPLLSLLSEKISLTLELMENMNSVELNHNIKIIFNQSLSFENYSMIDIYIRPDQSGSPWGRDILEAMWAGIPIVATGSSEEFILNGETGFLVNPSRPTEIADKVIQLLENQDLRRKMAATSATRARQIFDKKKYQERLLDVFFSS